MKKHIAHILVLLILCTATLCACDFNIFDYFVKGKAPLTYELSEDETYYIVTGVEDSFKGGEIKIPDTYNGKPVEVVKAGAFSENELITGVDLGNSVKVVERMAFYRCSNIEYVIGGESVEQIKDHAFYDCSALERVTLYGKNIKLEHNVFQYCFFLKGIYAPNDTLEAWRKCYYILETTSNIWDLYTGQYTLHLSDCEMTKEEMRTLAGYYEYGYRIESSRDYIKMIVDYLLTKQDSVYIGSCDYNGKNIDVYIYKVTTGEIAFKYKSGKKEISVEIPKEGLIFTSKNEHFNDFDGTLYIDGTKGDLRYSSEDEIGNAFTFSYFSMEKERSRAAFATDYIENYIRASIYENGTCELGSVFSGKTVYAQIENGRTNIVSNLWFDIKYRLDTSKTGLSDLEGELYVTKSGKLYYVTMNKCEFEIDIDAFSTEELSKADLIKRVILHGMMPDTPGHLKNFHLGDSDRKYEYDSMFNWCGVFYIHYVNSSGFEFCEYDNGWSSGFVNSLEITEKVKLDTICDELAVFGGTFTLCGSGVIEYVSDDGETYIIDFQHGEGLKKEKEMNFISEFIKNEIADKGEVYIGTTQDGEDLYMRILPDGTYWWGRNNAQEDNIYLPSPSSKFVKLNDAFAGLTGNFMISNYLGGYLELYYRPLGHDYDEPVDLNFLDGESEYYKARSQVTALDNFFYKQLAANDNCFYIGKGTSDKGSIPGGTGEYYLIQYSDGDAEIKEWHSELGLNHEYGGISPDERVTFTEYSEELQKLIDEYGCTLKAYGTAHFEYRSQNGYKTVLYYDEE